MAPRKVTLLGVALVVIWTVFGTCLGATALVEAWSRTYDSPPIPGAQDTPYFALWDTENNGIVVGITSGNGGSVPLALKLRGSDGTLLWTTHIEERPDVWFDLRDAALDPDGNLVVCGNWYGEVNRRAWITMKFSGSNGNQWGQVTTFDNCKLNCR